MQHEYSSIWEIASIPSNSADILPGEHFPHKYEQKRTLSIKNKQAIREGSSLCLHSFYKFTAKNLRRNSDVKAINQKRLSHFWLLFCSADLEWYSIDRSQRSELEQMVPGVNYRWRTGLSVLVLGEAANQQEVRYMYTTGLGLWFFFQFFHEE